MAARRHGAGSATRARYTEFDFDFERSTQRVEVMLQLLAQMKATLATLRFEDEVFDDFTFDELCSQFELDDREIVEIFHEFERRRQPQSGHILWQAPVDYATDLVSILRRFPRRCMTMPQASLLLVDEWHDVECGRVRRCCKCSARDARLVVVAIGMVINAERGADPRFSGGGFELAFPNAGRLPLSQSRRLRRIAEKLLERALPKCGFQIAIRTPIPKCATLNTSTPTGKPAPTPWSPRRRTCAGPGPGDYLARGRPER